ncbi:hypothetical protein BGZ83_005350 [Gryganskiella cystojenkinii]|nr:hypothetical protein BGZ83_005350 [Gryganskiella cystojenkinii]
MPTIFLPPDQYYTKFFLSNIVLLFGTTVSLMFMFLPKLWKLFSQIEQKSMKDRAEGSDESSFDGILQNRAGWLSNGTSGYGSNVTKHNGGSGVHGAQSSYISSGGRKGSVGTLEDGSDTLKESHAGYMGVKFQNRYFPFLSIWCMRRVILYPADRYFTCFELGKPESGRTFSFTAVSISSREPDNYILRVVGRGRYDFLLQVRDEERLVHWCNLFENKHTDQYSITNDDNVHPLSHLPLGLNLTRTESDQSLTLAPPNGGSGDGLSRKMTEDASYFTTLHHSQSIPSRGGGGLRTSHAHSGQQQHQYQSQHRHTGSAYTMVTFAASPSSSIDEPRRQTTMDPLSRQTTMGPADPDTDENEGSVHPLDRAGNSDRSFTSSFKPSRP